MKLKDELVELVDTKISEVTRMFEDVDRISIDPELIRRLADAIPLLQDVKTEVSDIQRQVHDLKDKKEKKEQKEDPLDDIDYGDDTVYPDPDFNDLVDRYDDLKKQLDDLNKSIKRRSLPGTKPDVDVLDHMRNFYVMWRLWKDFIQDKLLETMHLDDTTLIQNNIIRESDQIQSMLKDLQTALDECCSSMQLLLQSIKDKLDLCCQTMGSAMEALSLTTDRIEVKIDALNPQRQADQTLALEARARAIQSAADSIRGLL